ncbi:MAG: hypothetical protein DRP87_19650 [Spirochaetes bacterium]|nr:MAG: hypothetical protein DRP87_19650 [Spirochaetota bacterium]
MKREAWMPEMLPKILLCLHKAEAKVEIAAGWVAKVDIGRTKVACIVAPATATFHPVKLAKPTSKRI